MPGRKEHICRAREGISDDAGSFKGWGQSSRLGSSEEYIPEGIVAVDPITIASAAHLVITIYISGRGAFRAGILGAVERDP